MQSLANEVCCVDCVLQVLVGLLAQLSLIFESLGDLRLVVVDELLQLVVLVAQLLESRFVATLQVVELSCKSLNFGLVVVSLLQNFLHLAVQRAELRLKSGERLAYFRQFCCSVGELLGQIRDVGLVLVGSGLCSLSQSLSLLSQCVGSVGTALCSHDGGVQSLVGFKKAVDESLLLGQSLSLSFGVLSQLLQSFSLLLESFALLVDDCAL